jgi:hypothetical protein
LVLLFAGCQGQGQEWLRRWNGSATLNDGRMPFTVAGTLDITTGAGSGSPLVFAFRGGMAGSSVEFVCPPGTVRSAMVTASTATVATGSTCTLTATPDDGCTRDLTFNSGELTLTQSGATLTGMGSMRLTLACPGAGSSTSDVGFMLTAR